MTSSRGGRASYHSSPLRYPGGKAKLASYFKAIVRNNRLLDSTYIEAFAGGGGVGLALLLHGYVNRIILNDLSLPIYAFWLAILDNPDEFEAQIRSVELSVSEWERQREIFRKPSGGATFELGFAAFYLNRTNHSGVLNGGMIGGYSQSSSYGLDARFNREELAARVRRIARKRGSIEIMNLDAAKLLGDVGSLGAPDKLLIYIDPPYFKKGRDLYYDFYEPDDHEILKDAVSNLATDVNWVVSYDNEPEIVRLYERFNSIEYSLGYSVKNGRQGREIMYFSSGLEPPQLCEGGLQFHALAA